MGGEYAPKIDEESFWDNIGASMEAEDAAYSSLPAQYGAGEGIVEVVDDGAIDAEAPQQTAMPEPAVPEMSVQEALKAEGRYP